MSQLSPTSARIGSVPRIIPTPSPATAAATSRDAARCGIERSRSMANVSASRLFARSTTPLAAVPETAGRPCPLSSRVDAAARWGLPAPWLLPPIAVNLEPILRSFLVARGGRGGIIYT